MMDENDVLQTAQRRKRKEEAKLLKRKRIEEAGGKRPRAAPTTTSNEATTALTTAPTESLRSHSKAQQQRYSKSHNSKNTGKSHRFGRVMEHVPCRNLPRHHTLSIAVPGSIVSNCQTIELRTHLVGQIARAATIYHVDEIVVFDDKLSKALVYEQRRRPFAKRAAKSDDKKGENEDKEPIDSSLGSVTAKADPHLFMARLLQYCECPQYLRRHFFPMHPDLQFAGLLPPLDAPHHVRAHDASKYREGVVLDKTGPNGMSLVNCGIPGRLVEIDRVLTNGIRCTVRLDSDAYTNQSNNSFHSTNNTSSRKVVKGHVVSPSAPREDNGVYWGYSTRMADSLRAIFDESPYDGGYDVKIGTSERGTSVDSSKWGVPIGFHHALIVFGGVSGIEECVDADESMKLPGSSASTLFDLWLNTCPFQGSRTIRTEEAILVSLSRLSPFLVAAHSGSNGVSKVKQASFVFNNKAGLQQVEFNDEVSSEESD